MNAERMTCVRNGGYPSSIEVNKVYEGLPDDAAEEHGLRRIVDESGEDYLYPRSYFNPAGPARQPGLAAEPGRGTGRPRPPGHQPEATRLNANPTRSTPGFQR